MEIIAEEDEDDYDYGCPKECVDIIDDFIENRREDDFMYYYMISSITPKVFAFWMTDDSLKTTSDFFTIGKF